MTPKPPPNQVSAVLQEFQPFLKSIDMRTIVVGPKPEDAWENLITVLKISEKTLEEVKKRAKYPSTFKK